MKRLLSGLKSTLLKNVNYASSIASFWKLARKTEADPVLTGQHDETFVKRHPECIFRLTKFSKLRKSG